MSAQGVALIPEPHERRTKPRIFVPFHVKVHGVDVTGSVFHIETVLDNISADGLYVRIVACVKPGAKISLDVGLQPTSRVIEDAPRFSVDGVVLRTEEKPGGACGVAVAFERIRFL